MTGQAALDWPLIAIGLAPAWVYLMWRIALWLTRGRVRAAPIVRTIGPAAGALFGWLFPRRDNK